MRHSVHNLLPSSVHNLMTLTVHEVLTLYTNSPEHPYQLTASDTISHIADNVLDRHFTPDAPNRVWASDVTEFRVAGTKMYLSPIMDLYDHKILSYELSSSPNTAFTSTSLRDAIATQCPDSGLIVHTDQGFQYQHFM